MDNIRFALNLDGYVPEHIMDELRRGQEFLNRNEDLEEKDKFNSNVEQIFSKSRPKSKLKPTYNSYNQKRKAQSVLGYFGFDRTVYGDKRNTTPRKWRWLQELRQQRERDIRTEMLER